MRPRAAGELPQLNWLMRHTCATPAQRAQLARAAPPQLSLCDSANPGKLQRGTKANRLRVLSHYIKRIITYYIIYLFFLNVRNLTTTAPHQELAFNKVTTATRRGCPATLIWKNVKIIKSLNTQSLCDATHASLKKYFKKKKKYA